MPAPAPRIALIDATPLAMEPIEAALQRHGPQVRPMNLLDDSLSHDRAQAGRLTEAMVRRCERLARYAQHAGPVLHGVGPAHRAGRPPCPVLSTPIAPCAP